MRSSNRTSLAVVALFIGAVPGTAPATCAQSAGDQNASADECAQLRELVVVLTSPHTMSPERTELLRQLATNPPLAIVGDLWVTAVDLTGVLEVGRDKSNPPLQTDNRRALALAFMTPMTARWLPLPFVGHMGPGGPATAPDITIVPVRDSAEVLLEYIPPPPVAPTTTDLECYYFCGDPNEWDFDQDGQPNLEDNDDDNDGTPDDRDAFVYWPQASECECNVANFVAFTEKFSRQIARAVLSSYDRMLRSQDVGPAGMMQTESGPMRIEMLLPEEQCVGAGCPEGRYVSEDTEECARIRFRCETGEEPFSGRCGCGCRPLGVTGLP